MNHDASRIAWLALAALLFAGFVFLHWPFTQFLEGVVTRMGFATYQRALAGGFLGVGIALAGAVAVYRTPTAHTTWPAMAVLFVLTGLAHQHLVLLNVEHIHLVQYGVLALVLVKAGLTLEQSWLATTALGAIDEVYQYLFLVAGTPEWLDWNDIVFNALGAAFGVVIALHLGAGRLDLSPRGRFVYALLLAATATALFVYPPVLSPFYTVTPAGLRNHILSPGEGLALNCALYAGVRAVIAWSGRLEAQREPSVAL
ncbi:MAG: hypothetical protein AB7F99_03660 [Vicinamibacterales bacterium]